MYCKVKDLEIYCEIHGQGVPIVMVHGFGVDHRVMKCMEAVFETNDSWKRIYFDLPGMGKTEPKDWVKNSDVMVEVILQFIDQIIPDEKFLIVGESYGGYLIRAIIRERAKMIDGMLLICPMAIAEDSKRNVPTETAITSDEEFLANLHPDDLMFFGQFCSLQNEKSWYRFKNEFLDGFNDGDSEFKAKFREMENYKLSYNVDDSQVQFTNPSLIVTGKQDQLVGYKDIWNLLENYPRCTFATLDLAGHALEIDQEEIFNCLVKEWLKRVIEERSKTI
ncbi:MAG: alpha/beta fold hydrolase [Candidatus Hodarchaeales archaeon]|jgi:pimeloyl-ACP methyl ester carboxylesterase